MHKTFGMLTEILDTKKRLHTFSSTVKSDQKKAEERLGTRVNSIMSELQAFSAAAPESVLEKQLADDEENRVEEENQERVRTMSKRNFPGDDGDQQDETTHLSIDAPID